MFVGSQVYDWANSNVNNNNNHLPPSTFIDQQPYCYNYAQQVHSDLAASRVITPLNATLFGDETLFQPSVDLVVGDQYLLPAFTTIHQVAPSDSQLQNSRLYSDFLVDTPQPQYANLVVSGSTVKQPSNNKTNEVPSHRQIRHQPSFVSEMLSPLPLTGNEFLHEDSMLPAYMEAPPAPVQLQNFCGTEASYYNGGYFDRTSYDLPQPCILFPEQDAFQNLRHDAATDTGDLLGQGSKASKRLALSVGLAEVDLEGSMKLTPRPHRCSVCSKAFTRSWTLKQHLASHASLKRFFCPLCGKSMTRRQNVVYHLKSRHRLPNSSHWAVAIGSGVADDTVLVDEIMKPYGLNGRQCSLCGQIFRFGTKLVLLVGHARRHGAVYFCMASQNCRKRFLSIDALIKHSCQDHSSQPNDGQQVVTDCSLCSASFDDTKRLHEHLAEHARNNLKKLYGSGQIETKNAAKTRHKCLRCWKTFSSRLALARHTETESHSYSCPVVNCGRVFVDRRRLDRHIALAHSSNPTAPPDGRNFSCNHCQRIFTSSAGLTRHVSRSHKTEMVLSEPKKKQRLHCPFRASASCASEFDRPSQLEKHVKLYHRKRGHRKKKDTSQTT